MKKIIKALYITIFFTICIIPTAFFFIGNTNNNEAENRSHEKMPSIINDNKLNLRYPMEMEAYFSENFGFRTKMVNADAQINYSLLGQSSSPKVIVGKDNFLYYYEELNDYTGKNALNKESINQIIKTLELLKEYSKSKGSLFYFTIAPNKSSIYPEYMPDRFIKGKTNNYVLLKDALKNTEINFIDLKSFLQNEKINSHELLYHQTDSHWNSLGSLKAYRYLLSVLNLSTNLKDNPNYIKDKIWTGDIYKMLFPEGKEKDYEFIYDIPKKYTSLKPINEEDIKITTKLKTGEEDINLGKKLLIFRDSFFNSLVKFVSNDFIEVKYSREIPYQIGKTNDEIVILEIAERNIPLVTKSAPVMAAPLRNDVDLSKYKKLNRKDIFFYKDDENNYFHIYGYYKTDLLSNKEVLLKYNDTVFEAFPILEDSIKENIIKKYGEYMLGFSLRITKDLSINIDDFDIYIK